MSETPFAVEMQDIVIRFPGVLANDHVNFTLKQGRSMPCWVRMGPAKVP
jgi:ABC-type sugar transport system ATPase subunit